MNRIPDEAASSSSSRRRRRSGGDGPHRFAQFVKHLHDALFSAVGTQFWPTGNNKTNSIRWLHDDILHTLRGHKLSAAAGMELELPEKNEKVALANESTVGDNEDVNNIAEGAVRDITVDPLSEGGATTHPRCQSTLGDGGGRGISVLGRSLWSVWCETAGGSLSGISIETGFPRSVYINIMQFSAVLGNSSYTHRDSHGKRGRGN